jgi:hypothetical protein
MSAPVQSRGTTTMASRQARPRFSIAFTLSFLAAAAGSQTLPPALSFTGDAAVITILIRPDRTKEFEEVLSYALRATDRAGWQVFRSQERVQANATYIVRLDPTLKEQEYDFTRLIAQRFPGDAVRLTRAYGDALVGRAVTVMHRLPVEGLGAPESAGAAGTDPPSKITPVLSFDDADAAIVSILVKPDQVKNFEETLSALGRALGNNPSPLRRRQGAGWKVFKGAERVNDSVIYVMSLDPVIRNTEYDPIRLIQEAYPNQIQQIFQRYREAFVGQSVVRLSRVTLP